MQSENLHIYVITLGGWCSNICFVKLLWSLRVANQTVQYFTYLTVTSMWKKRDMLTFIKDFIDIKSWCIQPTQSLFHVVKLRRDEQMNRWMDWLDGWFFLYINRGFLSKNQNRNIKQNSTNDNNEVNHSHFKCIHSLGVADLQVH